MIKFRGIDTSDKQFLAGVVIGPILVWWFFTGRKKYGVKGMK